MKLKLTLLSLYGILSIFFVSIVGGFGASSLASMGMGTISINLLLVAVSTVLVLPISAAFFVLFLTSIKLKKGLLLNFQNWSMRSFKISLVLSKALGIFSFIASIIVLAIPVWLLLSSIGDAMEMEEMELRRIENEARLRELYEEN